MTDQTPDLAALEALAEAATPGPWTSYAFVCPDCRHLATKHRLTEGGSLIEGPYVCPCGCSRRQDDPWLGIDRRTFESRRKEADR